VKTPTELRRRNIKELFSEFIGEEKIELIPSRIKCEESSEKVHTLTTFVFEEKRGKEMNTLEFLDVKGKGFADCIFTACLNHYSERHTSLKNIKFRGLLIQPIFAVSSKSTNSDVRTNVVLEVEISGSGPAQFKNKSRSIVYSSFANILSAFQFYINCEMSFKKLQLLAEDAHNRERGDLLAGYLCKISDLTVINNYEGI